MSRELSVRSGPPPWVRLEPGQEWWEDYRHRLAARVREDRTVEELGRWELAPGRHGSLVRRVKPRPPAWRKPTLIAGGTSLVGLVLLALLVELVQSLVAAVLLLWPVALVFAGLWVGLRLTTGHRAGCVGLHCPGCRG